MDVYTYNKCYENLKVFFLMTQLQFYSINIINYNNIEDKYEKKKFY